jgi:parallel beta-helix repeat protein
MIDGNVILNTVTRVRDGGGIYVMDRGHSAKAIRITNNVVADFGSERGIYLDDETSNVLVANNIVYGKGRWGFQIHGGDHNTFHINIFDVSNLSAMGLYQDISGGSGANYGMADNIFTCNIIYASSNFQRDLWRVYGSGIEMPHVTNNNYYSTSGVKLNTGAIIDSSPVNVNPNFADAGARNYTVSDPPMSCFTPINMGSAGPRITKRP